MLSIVKDLIKKKTEFNETAAIIFEDGSGMNLDDSIVIGESPKEEPSEEELDNLEGPIEGEGGDEGGEEDGSDVIPEDQPSSDISNEPELDDEVDDTGDIMDEPIDDPAPGPVKDEIMDSEIDDDNGEDLGDELPAPKGNDVPITGDVDDILSAEIDLSSNTLKDTLPVPPANAGDAIVDNGDEMNPTQYADSGFGESVLTKDESFYEDVAKNMVAGVKSDDSINNLMKNLQKDYVQSASYIGKTIDTSGSKGTTGGKGKTYQKMIKIVGKDKANDKLIKESAIYITNGNGVEEKLISINEVKEIFSDIKSVTESFNDFENGVVFINLLESMDDVSFDITDDIRSAYATYSEACADEGFQPISLGSFVEKVKGFSKKEEKQRLGKMLFDHAEKQGIKAISFDELEKRMEEIEKKKKENGTDRAKNNLSFKECFDNIKATLQLTSDIYEDFNESAIDYAIYEAITLDTGEKVPDNTSDSNADANPSTAAADDMPTGDENGEVPTDVPEGDGENEVTSAVRDKVAEANGEEPSRDETTGEEVGEDLGDGDMMDDEIPGEVSKDGVKDMLTKLNDVVRTVTELQTQMTDLM